MKIYLHSLGCDKNLVDSEIMLGLLFEDGHKSVASPEEADAIIVNTCGFIQSAVEEGIETILEMASHNKKLIVTGCMAERYREEIQKEIPEVDAILGVNNFPKITQIMGSQKVVDIDVMSDFLYEKRANTMPMHVAYIKISEGCDNHCTYCTIPSIRGKYRERSQASILKECARLVAGGARELVLVAQDTACYTNLPNLLSKMAKIEDLGWIRLMYAYPEHITDELIEVIASEEKICNYIDMPIQHSHDNVIARMARKSTNMGLSNLIAKLQEKNIAIRTTLIAGFPGETEEEYAHLCNFIEETRFDHLGVFEYSQEDGTPAAEMKHQVDAQVKTARQEQLMAIQAVIADEKVKSFVGQTLKVMVDGSVGMEDELIAYSGRSQRDAYETDGAVFFSSPVEWMSGDFVQVKITKAQGYDMYGELVSA